MSAPPLTHQQLEQAFKLQLQKGVGVGSLPLALPVPSAPSGSGAGTGAPGRFGGAAGVGQPSANPHFNAAAPSTTTMNPSATAMDGSGVTLSAQERARAAARATTLAVRQHILKSRGFRLDGQPMEKRVCTGGMGNANKGSEYSGGRQTGCDGGGRVDGAGYNRADAQPLLCCNSTDHCYPVFTARLGPGGRWHCFWCNHMF